MELFEKYGTDVYITYDTGNLYFSFNEEGVSIAAQNG
jgi:hypothetical protein